VKAAAIAVALCTPAFATEPSSQQGDTAQEIQTLRARLDQLEAQQKASEAKRQEAERKVEEAATVGSVLKDAQSRDNLMAVEGFTAGYTGNRFVIQSADGNFVWRPWFHLQVRDVTMWRQDLKPGNQDETDNGFEIRRLKIGFDGNMFTPDFTYFFNWATSRASSNATVKSAAGATVGTVSNSLGGVPILEEAWVKYHFRDTPFYVKGGQIKDPLLHDQIVSSRYQQSAERSLTADVFANGDAFTEGVTFIYDPKSWVRTEGGITHGMRSANTNFLDYPNNGGLNAFNYGVAGRAEFKLFGRWEDYNQVGAVGTKEPLLVLGTGVDYSERGHSGQTVGVVDGMYADQTGLNFYGALVDRYTNHNFGFQTQSATGASIGTPDPAVANRATNEYSILAEAGYNVDQHWEPFGRYEYFHVEGTPAGSHNYFQVLTAGVNYYFVGHRAKFTAQAQYLPNGIPFDDGASDVLTNPHGRAELSFVAQFQLLL
jgi:hypothetical protein